MSLEQLALSKKWLNLGHYKKTWFGTYRSKVEGPFFLDPNGKEDPVAELKTSVQILFHENTKAQCKHMARTKWLAKQLGISKDKIENCPEISEWKNKLKAEEAYLVFAANDLGNTTSSFGHTFLRLHNRKNIGSLDLVDYGINYSAYTGNDGDAIVAIKGLFGGFMGYYSMLPYHHKIREYTNLEGRDLWEYKLNLSEAEVDELVDYILELEGSGMPYYFLSDNCSQQIIELLDYLRPENDLSSYFFDITIPIDTLKVIAKHSDLVVEEIHRPSLQSEFRKSYAKLDPLQKSALKQIYDLEKPDLEKEFPEVQRRAEVLDSALQYLSIREYREQEPHKEQRYALSVQRSKLGVFPSELKPKEPSPYESHDSAALYFGSGSFDGQAYSSFKFRRNFHDLVSNDLGMSPFSHVEAFGFEFQYFQSEKRWDLAKMTILKMITLNPVTLLERPLSWQFDFGTEPRLSPYLTGGVGYSIDIGASRLGHFAYARGNLDKPANFLGLGYQALLVNHHSDKFRSMLDLIYLPTMGRTPLRELSAYISYDLKSNLELRAQFSQLTDQQKYQLSLIW